MSDSLPPGPPPSGPPPSGPPPSGPPPSGPPPSTPPSAHRSRLGWVVAGVVLVLLLGVGGTVLALTGGDADSVQDVADQAVEAAEDLDVDAGIDLLCEAPTGDQRQELDDAIDGGREHAGTDDPDVTYDVSDVKGDASGSFRIHVTSDEDGLEDYQFAAIVIVESHDGRSCVAALEDIASGEREVVGEDAAD